MNILVTGAKGFIGKNLIAELKNRGYSDIMEFDVDTEKDLLDEYCKKADFVFNLAGVNRPDSIEDFKKGNYGFASELLKTLKKYNNKCPVMLSSSIQAALNNPYGTSKKEGEELFFRYGKEYGVDVLVYRFPNVFGKWCRPNYNSVIATFCYNITHNLPIKINDPETQLNLVYIDDVVNELINAIEDEPNRGEDGFCYVPITHTQKLGEIANLLYEYRESRSNLSIANMKENSFSKKLYATYLSYLPKDSFSYILKMNEDERGSFTEIIRTAERGQFSVNISKPGITKGNHWHHTKNEKFVVVSGKAVIKFRQIDSDDIISYEVSGEKIEVVDIPPGYTHNITNVGETDLVTFMWCSECFNPEEPDTYYLEV